MHGLRFSSWLEWRGWHLAGSASCARFSDGRVHRAKNKPAKGAETRRKMSHARGRGMRERWPVELTISMAFSVRAKHRGLQLKISLGAFPGYLSREWIQVLHLLDWGWISVWIFCHSKSLLFHFILWGPPPPTRGSPECLDAHCYPVI